MLTRLSETQLLMLLGDRRRFAGTFSAVYGCKLSNNWPAPLLTIILMV